MNTTTALQDRVELGGLPLYLPEQNAVLVGLITDGAPEMVGKAAYYVHWRDGVYVGNYDAEDHAFAPEYAVEAESRVMSSQVEALTRMDTQVELSSIGKALRYAYESSQTDLLPEKQAHVYALREYGFNRRDIASILNISPSTVDSQNYSAAEKVEAAEAFVSLRRKRENDGAKMERNSIQ